MAVVMKDGMIMKYDKMVEITKELSLKKMNLAQKAISDMLEKNEKITVAELVRRTDLSRGFFYKNEHVRNALEQALEKQNEKRVVDIRERVKKMSLEKQVAYYEKQLKEIISENERLKKENEKLRRKTIGKY